MSPAEAAIDSVHDPSSEDSTRILLGTRADAADHSAHREQLFTLVYDQLRRIAGGVMRGGGEGAAITPTGLVHELYLKLVDQTRVDWTDRARFLAIAGRAMRQILVDQARARATAKRGGGSVRVSVTSDLLGADDRGIEAVHLDDLFESLARTHERAATVAEMRVFGGLSREEIAHAIGVSKRTVDSDWKHASRWLRRELGRSG